MTWRLKNTPVDWLHKDTDKFIQLGDTPSSFSGQAGKTVSIKADETGLEFTDNLSTDEKIKVSVNDTTAGYLNGKLVAGAGVSLTENNDGANETLTVASTITQYADADAIAAIKGDADWNASDWDTAYGWGDHAGLYEPVGTKANKALDNLASVAINTSLISDTDSTDDLGSSSKYWANAYVDKIYLDSDSTIEASDVDGWNALVSFPGFDTLANDYPGDTPWTGMGYLTSVTAHDLLSATHGDTTASAVARGDLIVGTGATPKWDNLALGTAGKCLVSDGTDAKWSTSALGTAAWANTGDFAAALGADDNYVTDAEKIVIGNTSGSNTGDQVVPANEAGAANNFLTAYNSTTGAWTKARPTWANIDKTTSDIADITTKSHTSLSDIGTLTHATIDSYLNQAVKTTSSPTFAGITISGSLINSGGPAILGNTVSDPNTLAATYTTSVIVGTVSTALSGKTACLVGRTSGTGSGIFAGAGHLVFQPRNGLNHIFLEGGGTEIIRFTDPGQLQIYNGSSTGGIVFGDGAAGYDTNLYRSAANTLKTDDSLLAALSLAVGTATAPTNTAVYVDRTFSGYGGSVMSPIYFTPALGQDITTFSIGRSRGIVNTGFTATTLNGFEILDATGSGAVTTQNGLYIASLTKGSTNHAINIAGTGVSNDIIWGSDTNLYRSAANTLKTDDNFVADTLTLSKGANADWLFTSRSDNLAIQSQTSTTAAQLEIFSKDGDGTDNVNFLAFAKGSPSSVSNAEWLNLGWEQNTGKFSIAARKAGTGVYHDLIMENGGATALTIDSSQVLWIGSTADTNLYRSAANTLKTDDALIVGAGLTVYGVYNGIARFQTSGSDYVRINKDGLDVFTSADAAQTMYLQYYSGGAVNFLNGKVIISTAGKITTTNDLQVDGNTTLGNASTDTITCTGRLIPRTVGADPTSSATAGSLGEIVFYNNKWYGKTTGTGTDTNWSALN